jgi:hypothetical protein
MSITSARFYLEELGLIIVGVGEAAAAAVGGGGECFVKRPFRLKRFFRLGGSPPPLRSHQAKATKIRITTISGMMMEPADDTVFIVNLDGWAAPLASRIEIVALWV